MRKFKLSVHRYRLKLIEDAERAYGFADMETIEPQVKRYAMAKAAHKRGDFNPFTNDPNCKSCGKKDKRKEAKDDSGDVGTQPLGDYSLVSRPTSTD